MPRIVIRGAKKEVIKEISGEIFDEISKIIERPKEAFTLDVLESSAIIGKEEVERIYVEIGWKERPKEVCEVVAKKVEEIFTKVNYNHLIIYFRNINLENEYQFKK